MELWEELLIKFCVHTQNGQFIASYYYILFNIRFAFLHHHMLDISLNGKNSLFLHLVVHRVLYKIISLDELLLSILSDETKANIKCAKCQWNISHWILKCLFTVIHLLGTVILFIIIMNRFYISWRHYSMRVCSV